ncbi:glycoside hydrolase family 131 protein [Calocera viscosa TUFC12733]|uniref:Glycoside hydrolase family 131 protein n=1 Tax=Calocera viscosa (strain TUFC12733) TaxID=1330018 RepID=A0A167KYP9_CALVF|nr:glycoside hydrolase family 131 protein [Calocera viscosa TUFC12733]
MLSLVSLALCVSVAVAAPAAAPTLGSIIYDGRVPWSYTPYSFDANSSIYQNTDNVHGVNQTWDQIIKLPIVTPSMFDLPNALHPQGTRSVEVTLNDNSIFQPGGGPPDYGFRRSELVPAPNNGTDATVQGTTTFHWSVRTDPTRVLNYTGHEYHPTWHETHDYSTSEFTFHTGTYFNQSNEIPYYPGLDLTTPKTLRLAGRQTSPEYVYISVPFTEDTWHNFAVTLGWNSNEMTIYYSTDYEPLEVIAGPVTNNNTGGGQFHMGLLKLPSPPSADVLHEGYQESNLNEGLIYGGCFIEDSSEGGVRLSPWY